MNNKWVKLGFHIGVLGLIVYIVDGMMHSVKGGIKRNI